MPFVFPAGSMKRPFASICSTSSASKLAPASVRWREKSGASASWARAPRHGSSRCSSEPSTALSRFSDIARMCEDRSAEALRHGRRAEALRHGRPAKALRHRRLRLWRMPSGLRIVPLKAAPYILLAFLSCGCATNPATGQRQFSLMSEDQEIAIGRQQDAEVRRQMGVYDDGTLQQYVSDVGLRLARESERPNLPWQFTVIDVPAINAFALPGGYIYITRGLMAFVDDEAQLASVLGHEIGHVTARHAAQQY